MPLIENKQITLHNIYAYIHACSTNYILWVSGSDVRSFLSYTTYYARNSLGVDCDMVFTYFQCHICIPALYIQLSPPHPPSHCLHRSRICLSLNCMGILCSPLATYQLCPAIEMKHGLIHRAVLYVKIQSIDSKGGK